MLVIPALFFTSCDDDEFDLPANPRLDIQATTTLFTNQAGTKDVSITSNLEWIVESNQDWCVVTPSEGEGDASLKISVQENTTTAKRTAIILVKAKKTILNKSFMVEQLSGVPEIKITPRILTPDYKGGTYDIEVAYNVDYEIIMPAATWVVSKTPRTLDTQKATFEVLANTTQDAREAKVIFKYKYGNDASDTLTIKQEGIYDALLGAAIYRYSSVADSKAYSKDITITLDKTTTNTLLLSGILQNPLKAAVEMKDGRYVLTFDFPQDAGSKEVTLDGGAKQVFPTKYIPDYFVNDLVLPVDPDIAVQLTASTDVNTIEIKFDDSAFGLGEVYNYEGLWRILEEDSARPGSVSIVKKIQ